MMHSEYYGWVLELLYTWEESMLEARQLQEEEAINLVLQEEEALNQGLSDISLSHREGGQLMAPRLLCGGAEDRADQRVSAGPLSNTTGGVAILSSPTAVHTAAPHVADPLSPPVYDASMVTATSTETTSMAGICSTVSSMRTQTARSTPVFIINSVNK